MANIDQAKYATLIRCYFDACNEADYDKLVSCFTPDAVHYFPSGLPRHSVAHGGRHREEMDLVRGEPRLAVDHRKDSREPRQP